MNGCYFITAKFGEVEEKSEGHLGLLLRWMTKGYRKTYCDKHTSKTIILTMLLEGRCNHRSYSVDKELTLSKETTTISLDRQGNRSDLVSNPCLIQSL